MYSVFADYGATGTWEHLYYQGDPDYVAYDVECELALGDSGSVKLKMMGKLLEQKVCVEGMVTIVIRCMCDEARHYFRVKNNGSDITKTPEDMFPEDEIENDLKAVDTAIRKYYSI
jgi:hypothetical protein